MLTEQLESALAGIKDVATLTVAYEPVWAIGTGRAASGDVAKDTIGFIRRTLARLYQDKVADKIRILYGGSVTPDNTSELMAEPEIDGALVGGASLKAPDFLSIVKQAAETKG